MKTDLRASLEGVIQKWLDDNADGIGSVTGIWQDDSSEDGTAAALTAGAAAVFDGMVHQRILQERYEE